MATGNDDNDVDGDGVTGNEDDDDGDGATGDDNDDNEDDGDARWAGVKRRRHARAGDGRRRAGDETGWRPKTAFGIY